MYYLFTLHLGARIVQLLVSANRYIPFNKLDFGSAFNIAHLSCLYVNNLDCVWVEASLFLILLPHTAIGENEDALGFVYLRFMLCHSS